MCVPRRLHRQLDYFVLDDYDYDIISSPSTQQSAAHSVGRLRSTLARDAIATRPTWTSPCCRPARSAVFGARRLATRPRSTSPCCRPAQTTRHSSRPSWPPCATPSQAWSAAPATRACGPPGQGRQGARGLLARSRRESREAQWRGDAGRSMQFAQAAACDQHVIRRIIVSSDESEDE